MDSFVRYVDQRESFKVASCTINLYFEFKFNYFYKEKLILPAGAGGFTDSEKQNK